MKFKEFKSFRDCDRTFVKITNLDNKIKQNLKIEYLKEPMLGILYIDKDNGITLRILGDENNKIEDNAILLRCDAFHNTSFEIFEGTAFLKDVLDNQINKLYYDKKCNELLLDERLDEFRYEEFPYDVIAILLNDSQPEKMWVRLLMKTNEENLYVAELLDDSYFNKKYITRKKIVLIYYTKDNFKGLIINGLVRIED